MTDSEVVKLTERLVAIPSIAGDERSLKRVLAEAIKPLTGFSIQTFSSKGIPSILVYNRPAKKGTFDLLLNGHLDVVAGKPDQFKPVVKGDRLYGRGAYDMKAGAAALIYAFAREAKKVDYPLALSLVTDEEVGGVNGVRHQIDQME